MQQDCRHTVKDVNPTQIAAKLFGCLDKENMRIKNHPDLYYAIGKIEVGEGNCIPLWLFGFLY